MIILVFVDTHGNIESLRKLKKKAEKSDLVLCAGDITIFEDKLKKMLKIINGFGKKILIIHGNHESEEAMRDLCKDYDNIVFLHKEFFEKNNILFAGYGGGGFALEDKEFEKFARKIRNKREGKQLIMLVHQPPYGNKTDLVVKEHAGNKSYSEFIKKERPVVVICGHLHENENIQDKIGKSLIINPGPEGKLIDV